MTSGFRPDLFSGEAGSEDEGGCGRGWKTRYLHWQGRGARRGPGPPEAAPRFTPRLAFLQVHRDPESQLVLQEWKKERKEMR